MRHERLPHWILYGVALAYCLLPVAGTLLGFSPAPRDAWALPVAAISGASALVVLGWSVASGSRRFEQVVVLSFAIGVLHFASWRLWGYSSLLYLISILHLGRQLRPPAVYHALVSLLAAWGVAGVAHFILIEPMLPSDAERLAGEAVVLAAVGMVTLVVASMERELGRAYSREKEEAEVSTSMMKAARRLAGETDLQGLLRSLAEVVPTVVPCLQCSVWSRDAAKWDYVPVWRTTGTGKSATTFAGPSISAGDSTLVARCEAADDVIIAKGFEGWPVEPAGPHCVAIAPMAANGEPAGLLVAVRRDGDDFGPLEVGLLRALAGIAVSTIINQQRHRDAGEAAALRELNEMKSHLISTISHELRTPLSFVQAGTELLMSRLFDAEQLKTVAGLVNEGSMRLAELVDDIVVFADLQAGPVSLSPAVVDLGSLARDAIDDAAGPSQSHRVILEVADGLPQLILDGGKLKSVIVRLVQNALKFSDSSAPVVVRLSLRDERLEIDVSDKGVGIPSEEEEMVFQPFFRGARSHSECVPGAGLGLAIVKQLVDTLGGDIAVRSRPGEGTSIMLSILAKRVAAADDAPNATSVLPT